MEDGIQRAGQEGVGVEEEDSVELGLLEQTQFGELVLPASDTGLHPPGQADIFGGEDSDPVPFEARDLGWMYSGGRQDDEGNSMGGAYTGGRVMKQLVGEYADGVVVDVRCRQIRGRRDRGA